MFHSTARVPSYGTLFVPGDRPDRIPTALSTPADTVVIDLEDAVDATAKDSAREKVVAALERLTPSADAPAVFVRINGLDTGWAQADLTAVGAVTHRTDGVVIPKAEDPSALATLARSLPDELRMLPIVETARGVLRAGDIATAPRVRALMFGTLDLAANLGVTASAEGTELLHARSQLVLASAAAGLPGPIDGPYPALDDLEGLARSSAVARELGFAGKVVLHPRQIATVRDAFAPTEAELARARQVIEASRRVGGTGAARLDDGTFVDRPVVARAAALLGIDAKEAP